MLLVYTLAEDVEKERYRHVSALFKLINAGKIKAITSFYALHELFIIALQNAPDLETGSIFGKEALSKILETKIILAPLLKREDRILHSETFSKLNDASDIPHAISALVYNCEDIVAYDDHFKATSDVIPYLMPEEVIKE